MFSCLPVVNINDSPFLFFFCLNGVRSLLLNSEFFFFLELVLFCLCFSSVAFKLPLPAVDYKSVISFIIVKSCLQVGRSSIKSGYMLS